MDLSRIIPDFVVEKNNTKGTGVIGKAVVDFGSVTQQTQKDSYGEVLKDLGERQKQVLNFLKKFPNGATAKELAVSMYNSKLVPSPERNSVHPRLNELVEKGLVKVVGTKTCQYTNRTVAIYKHNK